MYQKESLFFLVGKCLRSLKFQPTLNFQILFQGITVSNTMLTACFFFTVLIFIQIYLFKNRFEKEIDS